MKLGFWEIIIVLIVALVVIGPDKLPEYAKGLGKALASLRSAAGDLSKDVQENIVAPLNEAQQPLREAVNEINDNLETASKSVSSIGRMKSGNSRKSETWTCPECGAVNTTNFCGSCGSRRPAENNQKENGEEGAV